MSLRLHMLQVARLAPRSLGDATELVRAFLRSRVDASGAGLDRAGKPDLYYSIFVLAGLQALDEPMPEIASFLRSFGDGDGLDFIHLGALARCRAAIGSHDFAGELLARSERHRSRDGGYDVEPGAERGNAYGCFVALGAYQDLAREQPEPLRMVQCLKLLETPDGAWGNLRGMKQGTVPATAAAITLLHQLGMPLNEAVGDWLLAQAHPQGGWIAVPGAPIPDLLSTATALHALACLDRPLPTAMRERCLDFIDSLWNAEGGFHGHWADDELDAEYTFYGLLALGHLSA
ncbi:MAG: prenyltransferase/squalene oxidase repeat-containing protein [Chthoniobacteraceae bacterium]